jgi:hypothetical protein
MAGKLLIEVGDPAKINFLRLRRGAGFDASFALFKFRHIRCPLSALCVRSELIYGDGYSMAKTA